MTDSAYRTAFLDWLACAARGRSEPAARAALAAGDPVLAAAAAGHVLDFDDTYLPGLAHLSAPTAPVALLVAAELGLGMSELLDAYSEGFEAMGALARASHPALYDRGLHPTAVCGGVGAAVVASALLGLSAGERSNAEAIALLGAAGLRAAFGSHGKSLQVGFAASAGVRAARLAAAGARVPLDVAAEGFTSATGGEYAAPGGQAAAIADNWIKAWPCCLQTHGAIEAASVVEGGFPAGLVVTVHPVSLQAAARGPRPADGLEAKFSIPYTTAWTFSHGPPRVESFEAVDEAVCALAEQIEVVTDRDLLESECVISAGGAELARVRAARGSPERPLGSDELAAKLESLGAGSLAAAVEDPSLPAAELLRLAGLGR